MTITREIDGKTVEIKLTEQELSSVYYQKQREFDIEDMRDYLCVYYDDVEVFKEEFGRGIEEANNSLDDLAGNMRLNMEKYDMSWEYARGEALRDWAYDRRVTLEHVGGEDYEETAE